MLDSFSVNGVNIITVIPSIINSFFGNSEGSRLNFIGFTSSLFNNKNAVNEYKIKVSIGKMYVITPNEMPNSTEPK